MRYLVSFLVLCFLCSCSNGPKKLSSEEISKLKTVIEVEANKVNKQMAGQKVDEMTTLLSAVFDGTDFVYTYEIDEDIFPIEKMRVLKDDFTQHLKETWVDNPAKPSLNAINAKVVYIYTGSLSEDTLKIEFEP